MSPALNSGERAALREKLRARGRLLRGELAAALHAEGESLALPGHLREVDDAVADVETDLEVAGVERDAAELEAIEYALSHLDSPAFGACSDCGEAIARERLFAEPTVRRCLACERRAERGLPRTSFY